ncbi:MAG: DnaJ C-terminal domain-containing protein [Chthoniobacteraceae bacterium]
MSSASPDHYAALGLARGCTPAEIAAAYRLLAKRHHPDLNPGLPEAVLRAQEVNAAHEILSDPARRRAYDRELSGTDPRPPLGKIERNITQDVHLRVEEFLRGTSLEVRVKDPANPHGVETYMLDIPAGTAPGARFRIARAEPFDGGWVTVRVKPRPGPRFKVRGSDLQSDLRISAARAAGGGSEGIASATGSQLRVVIPAGTARGAIIRLPGEGLPKSRGGRGDLLVRVTYRPEVRITRTFRR